MDYSDGKFGIKGQAKIYRDLGGTEEYNEEVWDRFGDRVGWREGGRWLERLEVAYHTTEIPFYLPVLMYYSSVVLGCVWVLGFVWVFWGGVSLLSRRDLRDCST
jgi:hypothetical protein